MEIEEHYHEVLHMLEGVLLHIFRKLASTHREEIEVVRSVYPSEEFLLPEPGKEVRLTFAEGQKLLREEGPEEFRNVSDEEDMSTVSTCESPETNWLALLTTQTAPGESSRCAHPG